ncbi:hypothetical protein, partial [Stenotrophomonas sp. YIM B06876]|uniref:hypothetical protein n=1 Tax=Stenotrophomonas sp. YIM B06876 TaxID=3060211 RepID=UPI002738D1EB
YSFKPTLLSQRGLIPALEGMDTTCRSDGAIPTSVRLFCLAAASICIYLALSLNLRHPIQTAMDVLTPLSLLLMAFARSYKSPLAKLALAASLFLWIAIFAAPHLFPSPLSW